jgi:hypothetical protein
MEAGRLVSDQRGRVSQLYAEALSRSVPERAAFLRQACGGDESLRVEVESLLAHGTDPPSLLDAPIESLSLRWGRAVARSSGDRWAAIGSSRRWAPGEWAR